MSGDGERGSDPCIIQPTEEKIDFQNTLRIVVNSSRKHVLKSKYVRD